MSVTALGQGVLYVLLAYWTVVVAVVEEKQPRGEAVKPGNSNNVVQQTQDLIHLSKLTTELVYNRARQLYKNISMLFLFPVTRDLLFTNI